MAINNNELNISNTSYVNKDFQTIYPEVVSLSQSISSRWNPDQTNESDPGIVLLKEASFIGDKNNYNIDKNVLEGFMPSATQESSMHDLCLRNGYSMSYYRASLAGITFLYTGTKLDNGGSFTLPAFTTQITDTDNSIVYTLVSPVVLHKKNIPSTSAEAIQGTCSDLVVGDSKVILLSALDSDRRIYFPVQMVAENGVFIVNDSEGNESASWLSSTRWKRVDNSNVYATGSHVYSFGYDSSRKLPYVEFPTDISYLVGSGLRIKYIVTSGESGNVVANFLVKLVSSADVNTVDAAGDIVTDTLDDSNLIIGNLSSTVTGSDPETINEAYSNFKRKVGTFDTLITCRDYENYIYGMEADTRPVVSNVQTSDRRTDLNYSANVYTFDEFGEHIASEVSLSDITPYDLLLYPLNPINTSYTISTYINSFTPLESGAVSEVRARLEDSMSLSHNFKSIQSGDIYAIKNYYTINARIATTYKVGTSEMSEILSNVRTALFRDFNARKVDYGEEIPYDVLLSEISKSDSRINSVSLDEPTVHPYVLLGDGTEREFTFNTTDAVSKDYFAEVEARNVLGLKVPLYSFNEYFSFDYGMKNVSVQYVPKGGTSSAKEVSVIGKLKSMSTSLPLSASALTLSASDLSSGTGGYTLRKHEVIQLIHPSYTVSISYPYGVNYVYSGASISKDSIHELGTEETLKLNYTDSSGTVHTVTYGHGKVIKPNFNLANTSSTSVIVGGVSYAQLGSSEEIDLLVPVAYTISPETPLYWSVRNSDNRLFQTKDRSASAVDGKVSYTHLLGEDEYLVYTNSSMTELVILESGTLLRMYVPETMSDSDVGKKCTISKSEEIRLSDVNTSGITAFSNVSWKYLGFTNDGITVTEMSIRTFAYGTSVGEDGSVKPLGNDFVSLDGAGFYYRNSDTDNAWKKLEGFSAGSSSWKARSRLDVDSSNSLSQEILSGQTVCFTDSLQSTYTLDGDSNHHYNLRMNTRLSKAGGDDIDLTVYTITSDGMKKSYDVQALVYDHADVMSEDSSGNTSILQMTQNYGKYSIDIGHDLTENGKTIVNLPFLQTPVVAGDSSTAGNRQLLMFYYETLGSSIQGSVRVSARASGAEVASAVRDAMETPDSPVWASSVLLHKGLQYIEVAESETVDEIRLEFTGGTALDGDVLLLGSPSQITGYNPALALTDADRIARLHAKMASIDSGKLFALTSTPDSSEEIQADSLDSADALWDSNNVANRFTIPEIDFDSSVISIVKSSRSNG